MKTLILLKMFLIGTFLGSCAPKKSLVETFESSYKIIKREPFQANGRALVTGITYDTRTGKFLGSVVVQVKEIKKMVFTDTLGRFSFEVPSGTYEIEVFKANTTISTELLTLEANTKTEIVFYIGGTVMW